MAEIDVERLSTHARTDAFLVRVTEGETHTEHRVLIATPPPVAAARFSSPEEFVAACFRFLLAHEPKESILSSFEVGEIGRYFPDWQEGLGPPD